jgi:hypothetical protein
VTQKASANREAFQPEAELAQGQTASNKGIIPQPAVAILGMHRSGTSMVAKLLHQAGLNLGSDDALMPPAEENPEGFYEHLAFVRLNDEMLNAAGAGWDCPPPADVDWASDRFAVFRDRARLLASQFDRDAPWGWKDPRTSLTIPFWRSALGPIKVIAVVRNPLEVVTSLHRRNGFSIALSLTLWQIYAERILADSTPEERLVTHYDAYFVEPERETARLLAFIGLDGAQDTSALQSAAVTGLRHHRKTMRDLVAHGFPPAVVELYRTLCREADWWEGDFEPSDVDPAFAFTAVASADTIVRGAGGVDLLRAENEALRRNNADFTAALAERELRIAELEMALSTHEASRAEMEGKIAERDSRLNERNTLIARRDHAISDLQRQMAHISAELAQVRAENAELADRLAASQRALAIAEVHERDLRTMLTKLHEVQHLRDAEIMGTLGAALSRHAPGAPAAIYHRTLVDRVRRLAEATLPAKARVLVATYGDPAMLQLGDRQTEPFPRSAPGISADYTDVSDVDAIAQLDALRAAGAEYLVVPGPAQPWLTNHPRLERHLDERYDAIARERGVVTIYALGRQQGQIPA